MDNRNWSINQSFYIDTATDLTVLSLEIFFVMVYGLYMVPGLVSGRISAP